MRTSHVSPGQVVRLLTSPEASEGTAFDPSSAFRGLDATTEGVALFTLTGERIFANRALRGALAGMEGAMLYREIEHLARSLSSLAALRGLGGRSPVEEVEVRKLPACGISCWLHGSYIGRGVPAVGGMILIVLERSPTTLPLQAHSRA